jgi:predicted dithiol-disulfide oxidoreductase (DUF899 family)
MAKKAKAKPKSRKGRQSPAAAKPIHEIRFPGESAKYRSARNALLNDEMALRAQIEAVSAKRRKLPLGGETPEDYVFDEVAANGEVRQVRMSELFTPGKETLVVAKSPIARIMALARERGWHGLRLLSSAGNTYNRDYHGENRREDQLPSLNVFVRRNGRIHHFYQTELLFAPTARGQDGRHVDMIWPLWNMFDVTPEGRGTDWYPRLRYS